MILVDSAHRHQVAHPFDRRHGAAPHVDPDEASAGGIPFQRDEARPGRVHGCPAVRLGALRDLDRAFTEADEQEHSTSRLFAIVNETFAAMHWPGEDAIGKRFRVFDLEDPLLEVVGIGSVPFYNITEFGQAQTAGLL